MKTFQLKGGDIWLTDSPQKVYRVTSGSVLLYVLPVTDGDPGRRILLYEAEEETVIPSLYLRAEEGLEEEHFQTPHRSSAAGHANGMQGRSVIWQFGLVALSEAVVCEEDAQDLKKVRLEFAETLGVRLFDPDEFQEQMVEQYNIRLVREESVIYATSLEQKRTYDQGLMLILRMFQGKEKKAREAVSGNKVYDAAAELCAWMNIRIAPFEKVKESCRRRITIGDIARLSHFTTREIILEEKWFARDLGPFLAYKVKGRGPVACIPHGPGKYLAVDAADQSVHKVDEGYARTLERKADMIYRPFPPEPVGLKKLLLFGLQGAFKRDFVYLGVLALLGTLIGLLIPVINQQLYDKFIPMGDGRGLVEICMVALCCCAGNLCFTIVKNLATFRSMNSMEYVVQSAAYDRLFNLPESFFREYESADLAQRTMGVTSIFQAMADVMMKTVLSAVFSLLYLFRMLQYDAKLAGIAFLMVFLTMLVTGVIGYWQLRYEGDLMEYDGKISSVLYQFLGGISKIRIAGIEDRALLEYLKPFSSMRMLTIRKEKLSVLVDTLIGAAKILFSMVLYFFMMKMSAVLTVGSFMGFITAFGAFSAAMLQIVSSFMDVNHVIPAYQRCKPILDALPEFDEETLLPGQLTGDIEISNVTFAYDKEAGPVLTDLSVHIQAGEYIGLVGSSGCGKSTLLKLLLGFERPQKGKVYYDGRDIDSMDKRELRKKFGVVLQDGALISGSIFENIVITSPNTSVERVQQVIEEVGLKEDIEQMPMGLHTVLSENSGTISGGQQQRLLIARAIVGKPRILFFDEATSALDNVTQAMVCESLERLRATRIVIAHRLSTVMNCDRIIVMDHGSIVEEGNYEQLMEKKGMFYQLAARQMA